MVGPLLLNKKRGEVVPLEVKHQMLSFIQTAIWMFSKDRASYYAERISKLTFINYSAIICTSVKVPLSVSLHAICPLPFRGTESHCCWTREETPSQLSVVDCLTVVLSAWAP